MATRTELTDREVRTFSFVTPETAGLSVVERVDSWNDARQQRGLPVLCDVLVQSAARIVAGLDKPEEVAVVSGVVNARDISFNETFEVLAELIAQLAEAGSKVYITVGGAERFVQL